MPPLSRPTQAACAPRLGIAVAAFTLALASGVVGCTSAVDDVRIDDDARTLDIAATADAPPHATVRHPLGSPPKSATTLHALPSGKGVIVASTRHRAVGTTFVIERLSAAGDVVWTWEGLARDRPEQLWPIGAVVTAEDETVVFHAASHLFAVRPDGTGLKWVVPTEATWGDKVGLVYDRAKKSVVSVFRRRDNRAVLQRRAESDGRLIAERNDLFTPEVGIGRPYGAVLTRDRSIAVANFNQIFLFDADFTLLGKTERTFGVQLEVRDERGEVLARRFFPREDAQTQRAVSAANRGVYLLSETPDRTEAIVRRFQL
jgi:hypothetical protein